MLKILFLQFLLISNISFASCNQECGDTLSAIDFISQSDITDRTKLVTILSLIGDMDDDVLLNKSYDVVDGLMDSVVDSYVLYALDILHQRYQVASHKEKLLIVDCLETASKRILVGSSSKAQKILDIIDRGE
jgi:hypothetical protein